MLGTEFSLKQQYLLWPGRSVSSRLLLCEMDKPDKVIVSHHSCVSEIFIDICAELLSFKQAGWY